MAQESWRPAWTRHEHLLPKMREAVRAQDPVPFRFHDGLEVDWEDSPNGSDEGLLRFLQARDGDVRKASEMFLRQLKWRRRAFPILREGRVAEILDEALPHKEKRYVKMGTNAEGLPVILQNLMWGKMVTERYSSLDCVRAYILFIEENVITAPTFLERQMIVLSYGGFCPADWGRSLVSILQDNYPERLVGAVIWPVPGFLCKTVRTFVQLLAAKETSAKMRIETEEGAMLRHTKLQAAHLPDYMTGGPGAIFERDRPDLALLRKMVVDAFLTRGRSKALEGWPPVDASPALGTPVAASSSSGKRQASSSGPGVAPGAGCFGMLNFANCGCWARGGDEFSPAPLLLRRRSSKGTLDGKEAARADPQLQRAALLPPPSSPCKAEAPQAAKSAMPSLPGLLMIAVFLMPVLVRWIITPALMAL